MSAVPETGYTPSYDYWRAALAGNFGPVHDGCYQYGFFRKRLSRAGAFVPVAIWGTEDGTVCLVDNKPADPAEIWSYVCQYPITEDQYRQRVATGKWHDEDAAVTTSLTHDTKNENIDQAEVLADQIDAAMRGVGEYDDIRSDEDAAKAQSLRSRLLELSGNADKLREDRKRPHLEAGRAIDAVFQPLVKKAKEGADAIRKALGAHETRKAQEAERIRREQERARLAAEAEALKAAEAGKPAPEPVPLPPAPEPAPAPAANIRGAYGRAAAVKVVKVAKVVDQDKAYHAMREHKELVELIGKLAQRAATAGIPIAGVEVTEERVVS